ncbi:MAG: MazG-related NTP pyrophosphohydrolase BB0760, partial [uncultured Thermoleophilia bacterium]
GAVRLPGAVPHDGGVPRRRREPPLPDARALRRGRRGGREDQEDGARRRRRAVRRAARGPGQGARGRPVVCRPDRHGGGPGPRRDRRRQPRQAP